MRARVPSNRCPWVASWDMTAACFLSHIHSTFGVPGRHPILSPGLYHIILYADHELARPPANQEARDPTIRAYPNKDINFVALASPPVGNSYIALKESNRSKTRHGGRFAAKMTPHATISAKHATGSWRMTSLFDAPNVSFMMIAKIIPDRRSFDPAVPYHHATKSLFLNWEGSRVLAPKARI